MKCTASYSIHRKIRVPHFLCIVLSIMAFSAHAEIFKCTVNGKTVFSDSHCGESAEIIDVEEATKPTGTKFSTDSMDSMGQEMGKERRIKELDRDIDRQQTKINSIIEDYNSKRASLEKEMSDHKSNAYNKNWNKNPYKREQYYERQREIQNQINDTYRRYKSDKEIGYKKLQQLRQERHQIH